MKRLVLKQFRVRNFRNIDDSGWIPLEHVTAMVGRNESGKSALLKALHKFNPGTPEPYNPQREFPRDRFMREFRNGADWPVCSLEFELSAEFRAELRKELGNVDLPNKVTCTRSYDGSMAMSYDTSVTDKPVSAHELVEVLQDFASDARRLAAPSPEQEQYTAEMRASLANWAASKTDTLNDLGDLKNEQGVALLKLIRSEANARSGPLTADLIESLLKSVEEMTVRAATEPLPNRLHKAIEKHLPVFIYFENYGILESAIYLPQFLDELLRTPDDSRVRTVNAMFRHVGLTAQEVYDLGQGEAAAARATTPPLAVTPEMIERDQQRLELRSVKLNSASTNISDKFSSWYKQRRHHIRYQADGDYFRIWVSDDRRPGVEIELESRSKGFQWFFSFYLIFLAESENLHRDAILLLDEPALHLHPTAQQDLIAFFEELAKINGIIYTTHSPFLIDGEHLNRVRPVREDKTGHSHVSIGTWPEDRDTVFPLQAAAGYAMLSGLFNGQKNVLVEGLPEYLYLNTLNLICRATQRTTLPDDIRITPCGSTKLAGPIASLFQGHKVRPVVLLDGDEAGRVRRNGLLKELYAGHENGVLLLSDVLGIEECEVEDILGDEVILPFLSRIIGSSLTIGNSDRMSGSLPVQSESAATRAGVKLPPGWRGEVARRVAEGWSSRNPLEIPGEVLERAERLFRTVSQRFEALG